MEKHLVLYIEPNDVWANILRDSVGKRIEIVRVQSAEEAQAVIRGRKVSFGTIVLGTFDVLLAVWLKQSCQCPIVTAAWLPKDNEALLKVGCTHRVPRKEGAGMYLNSLFES